MSRTVETTVTFTCDQCGESTTDRPEGWIVVAVEPVGAERGGATKEYCPECAPAIWNILELEPPS